MLGKSRTGIPLAAERVRPARREASPINIFSYTDYRVYLNDFYNSKKVSNRTYSMSSFVRRAGLGKNSRGYLKLIIQGKRNLTPHTLRRFSEALGLNGKESLYFENLVYFNQAKSTHDRDFYFQRSMIAAQGRETRQIELLKCHYRYYTNWYYVAIRELVALPNFVEDAGWISNSLQSKINKKQAQEALENLLQMELLARSPEGRLVQTESCVKMPNGKSSDFMQKFHLEMIDRGRESLVSDGHAERDVSSVTLSCAVKHLENIKKEVSLFRDQLIQKFAEAPESPESVIQVNFQVFQLTRPQSPTQERNESYEA